MAFSAVRMRRPKGTRGLDRCPSRDARQIAGTAVFLASDDANATTGQVLYVSGGSYMP